MYKTYVRRVTDGHECYYVEEWPFLPTGRWLIKRVDNDITMFVEHKVKIFF